jgi:hypothetical protein
MAEDLLTAIQNQLASYAVGLVKRVEGAGSTVIGSGVLVSVEDRRGILTCAHVAEKYDKRDEIGLVRFIPRTQQSRIVNITAAQHVIVHSLDEWTEGSDKWKKKDDLDLAFTCLSPEVADSIAAQSIFLNIEKNRLRIEGGEPTDSHAVDVMFGLVDEYSGKPFIEDRRFVSPMHAVIYRGKMHSEQNGLLHFQTIDDDPEKLPKSFGGLSGSGLWRIHFVDHGAGKFEILERRLWGITAWQIDKQNNRGAVAGQGWDRSDQALIPHVRDDLPL